MPLFWNSIFRKSSFKCKTQFLDNRVIANLDLEKKKIYGTQVPWIWVPFKELEFMELEFHLNIFKELEFHEHKFHKFFFF